MKNILCSLQKKRATAIAFLRGSAAYPELRGSVLFYSFCDYVIVQAEITGLPEEKNACSSPVFAFHIHEGTECSGNETDPFANAGLHFNPNDCLHPYHAGDMPPLFGVRGNAFLVFMTDRFTVPEVLGRAVIIHAHPDDFVTQPSGNSGAKIACGVIESLSTVK